jgi:hypothetical protein
MALYEHEHPINKETYLRNKWGGWFDCQKTLLIQIPEHERNREQQAIANLLSVRAQLHQGFDPNWSIWDFERIDLAEFTLLEVMEGHELRKDNDLYETHCMSVALKARMAGGGVSVIVKALNHDDFEEGKGKVSKNDIKDLFGEVYAHTIDKLSKSKSSIADRDLPLRTKHNLLELAYEDPEGAAVKLFDREHFWETSDVMDARVLKKKAYETLEVYVPLATAFGFHEEATSMAGKSLEVLMRDLAHFAPPWEKEQYRNTVQRFSDMISHLAVSGWCIEGRSEARQASWYDLYKAVEQDIDSISKAEASIYVPIVIPDTALGIHNNGISRKLPDAWSGSVDAIADCLYNIELLSKSAHASIEQQSTTYHPTISENFYINGTLVRILFIRQSVDTQRKATVFDMNSDDPKLREAATAKISGFQQTIKALRTSMHHTIQDVGYCLNTGGAKIEKVIIRRPGRSMAINKQIGVAQGATLVDILYSTADLEKIRTRISGARIISEAGDDVVNLSYIPPAGATIDFVQQQDYCAAPSWLDHAVMPSTRRKIYLDLLMRIKAQGMTIYTVNESSLYAQVADRGARIIKELFTRLTREKNLEPVNVDDINIMDGMEMVNKKSPQDRLAQYYSLLWNVGMNQEGYEPDLGRTSTLWEVVRRLIEHRYSLQTFEVYLRDTPGQLLPIIAELEELGVNILGISPVKDDKNPTHSFVRLCVTPDDYTKLKDQGVLRSFPTKRTWMVTSDI